MRVRVFRWVVVLLFCASGALAGGPAAVDDGSRIRRAVDQLARSQRDSGLFAYAVDLRSGADQDSPDSPGLRLVRNAAAAFAVAGYLLAIDDPTAEVAVRRFLDGMAILSVPIGKRRIQRILEESRLYNRWRLWPYLRGTLNSLGLLYVSEGEGALISPHGDHADTYPGATALAIVAALAYRARTGDERFDALIRRWIFGVISLRVPGRGFRESPERLGESHYLNAQAWLALASYREQFSGEPWLNEVLEELDQYMLERYGHRHHDHFYHWGTMASALRARQVSDSRLGDFLNALTENMMAASQRVLQDTGNSCHVVEGLAAFIRFMQRQGRDDDRLVRESHEWVGKLMERSRRLQVDRSMAQSFAGLDIALPKLIEFDGAFMDSASPPVVKVDYTGHCLNALVILSQVSGSETDSDSE